MAGKMVLVIGDWASVAGIGEALSSLGVSVIGERSKDNVSKMCGNGGINAVIFDKDTCSPEDKGQCKEMLGILRDSNKDFMVVSSSPDLSEIMEAEEYGAKDYIVKPYNLREFITRFNAVVSNKKRLVCIGGGTGLFHMLMGLKSIPNTSLISIVSMSDDGGSSGKLKTSFGVLPPGDVRRSLVALSNAPEIMNRVMQYRFAKGPGIEGHSFGNLFLTALAEIEGTMPEAVRTLGNILNIQGIVLPVTNTLATLAARFEDGTVVKGESNIDLAVERSQDLHISDLWHEPETECNVDAFLSIVNSDVVIIGPGDLYTSVVTNFRVRNIKEAVSRSGAKKIYMCNLMTKPGETAGFTAYEHIREVIKYLGGDHLDHVVISSTVLSGDAISEYTKKNQHPVAVRDMDEIRSITKAGIIMADVGHETELVRHDGAKICKVVRDIMGI